MRKQKFKYVFTEPKEGDCFANLNHIKHAICNSDQYPVTIFDHNSPEGKLQDEVLKAVINAIEAVPRYVCQGGKLIKEEK